MGGVPIISIEYANRVIAYIRQTLEEADEATFIIELQLSATHVAVTNEASYEP